MAEAAPFAAVGVLTVLGLCLRDIVGMVGMAPWRK